MKWHVQLMPWQFCDRLLSASAHASMLGVFRNSIFKDDSCCHTWDITIGLSGRLGCLEKQQTAPIERVVRRV